MMSCGPPMKRDRCCRWYEIPSGHQFLMPTGARRAALLLLTCFVAWVLSGILALRQGASYITPIALAATVIAGISTLWSP